MKLPDPQALSQILRSEQVTVIDTLFEHNDKFADFIIKKVLSHNERYGSYREFIKAVRIQLIQLADNYEKSMTGDLGDMVRSVISAHPRLGIQQASALSVSSAREQKSLQSGKPELARQLLALNQEYEHCFPGLRFVVFVNGRSRQEITKIMRKRITRDDYNLEVRDAFSAMCDIALDRIKKGNSKL
ncbi:hypothetical protein BRETT_000899 [Brettanomyces bruxellensis]|uniref:Oxo-4-hydroxy-4-carboxy-5-ureidoimidazoline decarboxylase domain-containing protein n=1 Tax=Dekkera bruxellensis TaxID=5007 RepID=A0A871R5N1_DEKBR|nr:uncharacterized protein BRETT_000899 [Brettanomyces bruxellensis]QOU21179.1 hypothetical protein BRETT_000899 [Brettanomyces bruxellensis]